MRNHNCLRNLSVVVANIYTVETLHQFLFVKYSNSITDSREFTDLQAQILESGYSKIAQINDTLI
jgi:hypothetical protein